MQRIKLGVVCGAVLKSGSLVLLVGVFLGLTVHRILGQEKSKPLPPTEAYKSALAPFTATRSQPNDLTDADKDALGIGIAQASHDCLALSSNVSSFASNANELFGLGQLCIFGQQFEPARAALVNYLAFPEPPQREQALVLLVRAFLGLDSPVSAEAQLDSLLRDYPYDASIHAAIDQVIDYTEGVEGYLEPVTLKLCEKQSTATLPLLAKGRSLDGANGSASGATLFADAVRCAALSQNSGRPNGLDDLAAIVQGPSWADTADLAVMRAALKRQQMVGTVVPLAALRGNLLGTSGLTPRTISLRRGMVLLLPFTLWSPSTPEITRDLANLAPRQAIYAITSWRANTGRDDVRSNEVLEGLRSWQKGLPPKVSILVVPDSVLAGLHSVAFPIGILIRDGIVLSNTVLSSPGAERLVINALKNDAVGQ